MAQNTMGKLLPNLKITLGNDADSDDQLEEGELSDTIDDPENIPENQVEERKVDMIRSWKTLSEPKVYKNKDGAFITGLDLTDPAVQAKCAERGKRFGLEGRIEKPVTQEDIDALYKSLGIDPKSINSCKVKGIRLDALHVHGLEEMDTFDVFGYFKDYGPASIEWINDKSCNVLWLDTTTTARAIIGMTLAVIIKKKRTSEQGITESKEGEGKFFDEEVIEIPDLEEGDNKDKKEFDEESMEIDSLPDCEKPDDAETTKYLPEIPAEMVDIPVPPGYWRLGIPHPMSKAILLRFATKGDKKSPGAEKRSAYYQKYGNPNYGGLKGLISSSRKRKMQAARNRQVVEKFTEDSKSQLKINSGETSNRTIVKASRSKMPRMRMYADDEEDKKRKNSFMRHTSGRQSVHSRLGTKYTKEDLLHLGPRFSSESEEEDDNVDIHCTVPKSYDQSVDHQSVDHQSVDHRNHIWTDLAINMLHEDNYKPRCYLLDTKPFDRRKYRHNRATRDRSFARDQRSPESVRGSRPWRPSRDESSQDLRSSLNYQRRPGQSPMHISPLHRPQEDLRSKIKRIKKDTINKHRSPMFMDD